MAVLPQHVQERRAGRVHEGQLRQVQLDPGEVTRQLGQDPGEGVRVTVDQRATGPQGHPVTLPPYVDDQGVRPPQVRCECR
ncbi:MULTISPECIES: hypothetical protein [Streptomyces]|uniref:hypothetical protein n=1 Tax=Streptomyces TaxID=1883 RepID=UPI001FD7ABD4|nr:hypothetical protein [Streptomyces durhamensis]